MKFLTINSDSTHQKWMKFAFTVTCSIFLHSCWVSDNVNCCRGNFITVRGIHYFFHQLALDSSHINIYIILENGTMVDLNIDQPFEKENGIQRERISLAPFYQRFSKLYHTKWIKIYLLLTLYVIQLIWTTNQNLEFFQWKDLWNISG